MRLGVRAQLLGTTAATLAVIAVAGSVALLTLASVEGGGSAMYDNSFVPATQLNSVSQAFLDEARLVNKGIVQVGVADAQASIDKSMAADDRIIETNLALLAAGNITAEERGLLTDLETLYQQYKPLRDATRRASLAGDTATAVKVAVPDPASLPPELNLHKVAAWAMVSRAILNLDETITKE